MSKIIPAILTENLETFSKQIKQMERVTNLVHIDICDGQFVPTRTLDAEEMKTVSTTLKYELHLMVAQPSAEIDKWYNAANISRIIFHHESTVVPPLVVDQIEEGGREAGLTFNPTTPLSSVEPYFSLVKYIMVMGVIPGRQGQPFVPETVERLKQIKSRFPALTTTADGGIHLEQIKPLLSAGADYLVIGSEIFAHPNPVERFKELERLTQTQ